MVPSDDPAEGFPDPPPPFLQPLYETSFSPTGFRVACALFEAGRWRADQFAAHLVEWIPEFALNWAELQDYATGTSVRKFRRAARRIYKTRKTTTRGEVGELVLHCCIRQFCGTRPFASKYYYKDSANETIKGWDCVHAVVHDGEAELWLGEAKFYQDGDDAVSKAIQSVRQHVDSDFLRAEFGFIHGKVDPTQDDAELIRRLLDENTSLDDVFSRLVIPILICWDSPATTTAASDSDIYRGVAIAEAIRLSERFANVDVPDGVRFELVFVPLGTKEALVECFDRRLEASQAL